MIKILLTVAVVFMTYSVSGLGNGSEGGYVARSASGEAYQFDRRAKGNWRCHTPAVIYGKGCW